MEWTEKDQIRLDKSAEWLHSNMDKKGTPEWTTVVSATKELRSRHKAQNSAKNEPAEGGFGLDKAAGVVADKVKAGLYGLQDALFMGADDEINAGIQWAKGKLTGENEASFSDNLTAQQEGKKQLEADNPYAFSTGQAASMFAVPAATANAVRSGTNALRSAEAFQAANPIKSNAVMGAVGGYNSGENTEERLQNMAVGGVLGGALGKVASSSVVKPDEPISMAEKRVLSKAKAKMEGTDFKASSVVDADRTLEGVRDGIKADLALIKAKARKQLSEDDMAKFNGIVASGQKKTPFTNPEEAEWVRGKLGGDLGEYTQDLLDEARVIESKFPNRQGMLPMSIAGSVADAATNRTSHGAWNAFSRSIIGAPLRAYGERSNSFNKAMKSLDKTGEAIAPSTLEAHRKGLLQGTSKAATAREKLQVIDSFKGFDIEDPSELLRYVDEIEAPRLTKLDVKSDGQKGQGTGLAGSLLRENGVSPHSLASAALEVAEEQGLPLQKAWTLFQGESNRNNLSFLKEVRRKLQDNGQWRDSSGVAQANRKAHSKRSTLQVRRDLKGNK